MLENEYASDDDEEDDDPMMSGTTESVKVFACSHTYHFKCLRKHYRKKLPITEV